MDMTGESDDDHNSIVEPLTLSTNETNFIETPDEVQRKTESNVQQALNNTGFGKFNYKIIIISGMICMNVAYAITSVGFIIPSAACDFSMNTIDKSRLSAAPIFGMLLGSFIWGCIADTKGRRTALLNCLFLQGIFEFFASVISNYWSFIVFKILSGLALSGQMSIVYTYVGEFQPENYREKALSLMEIPWVVGMIFAPVIAWIILPLELNLEVSTYSFKSWNLYAVICSLLAFIVSFLLLKLPETPKYLAEMARYNELRNVLTAIHRENTGRPTEEYIVKLNNAGVTFLDHGSNDSTKKYTEKENIFDIFCKFFINLYKQTIMLYKPPYVGKTIITCIESYCIFASLYTLMLWFPELFQRFAAFEEQHPGEGVSVCTVSQSIIEIDNSGTKSDCNSTMETQVYVHSLILAVSCIPVAIIFSVCAKRLGFRFYLVFNSFGCCAVTIGLIFVTTSTENLILSCIYEALMSACITALFCISVEIFPTNLRVTASALASLFGRIGALIGNTMFGYLIDHHCFMLITIVAIELFIAGILGFFINNNYNDKSKKNLKKSSHVSTIGLTHSSNDKYHSSIANEDILSQNQ